MRKKLRTYFDAVTGMSYRVNTRTGIVCATDGTYPDHKTEVRIRSRVATRVKSARTRRHNSAMMDLAMADVGMVKVRVNGKVYWE